MMCTNLTTLNVVRNLIGVLLILAFVMFGQSITLAQGTIRRPPESPTRQDNQETSSKVANPNTILNPHFSVNASPNSNLTICGSSMNLFATAGGIYGTWTYKWTLYKNGSPIHNSQETITCPPGQQTPCQTPSYAYNTAPVSGAYKVRLVSTGAQIPYSDEYSNEVQVTASSGGPVPMSLINGSSNTNVTVCPGGPITLDGSQSACAQSYFLSVQLSDAYWNRYGPEITRWLKAPDYQKYGPLSSFNVKKFSEDRYFTFVGGQFYRVTLAVGPGWHPRAQLIYIKPPAVSFTINGSLNSTVNSISPTYPITMNGSGSTCASAYFLSVQLSDSSWNRYGPEATKWLTTADFNTYGSIYNFNVKKFAEDRSFIFVPGQYYRVKLAIGPGWTESSKLVYINP